MTQLSSDSLTHVDDAQLLERWCDGDGVAGNVLVRRHFGLVYRFCRARMDEGVADLVQRIFLACVAARERVPEGLPFKAYLLGIARNQVAMELRTRRRSRRWMIPTGVMDSSLGRDPQPTPSAVASMREEQRLLLRALRALSVDLQVVLQLHYWERMRMDEISAIVEVPVGTVKSRLFRARTALRNEILAKSGHSKLGQTTIRDLDHWASSIAAMVEVNDP